MATGIVVGLPTHRETWSSTVPILDESRSRPATASFAMSPVGNLNGHHRSFSEARDSSSRPRLPSISNFLEGAGQLESTFPQAHQGTHTNVPYQNPLHSTRSPLSPPGIRQQPWSPKHHSRQLVHHGQSHTHRSEDNADGYFVSHDYRRPAGAESSLVSIRDSRSASSYSLKSNLEDQTSPIAHKTTKNVIREDMISGKPCYVYDDGTVCQKVINGDTVNPKWGTTKAGKPRKRLGQACNTCREKKIKCDPSFPKCTQCTKFGRECRFEAPTRPGHKSPEQQTSDHSPAPNLMSDELTSRRTSTTPVEASTRHEPGQTLGLNTISGAISEHNSFIMADTRSHSDGSPVPSKRARLTQLSSNFEPMSIPRADYLKSPKITARSIFSIDVDPYAVSSKLTELYLKAYFSQTNTTTFGLVPENLFMRWVGNEQHKPKASRLVLYCMLAVGCRFARSSDRAEHEEIFTKIALEGIMQPVGHFSIQLIHARLILTLHEFQVGNEQRAWDFGGAAMRAACAMRLNMEDGIQEACRTQESVYGIDGERVAECLRRTFWTTFIMDRFAVSSLGYPTTFGRTDLFLRLPCTDRAYLSGRIPQTPLFDGEEGMIQSKRGDQPNTLGPLAYLALVASLCCDIYLLASRARQQPASNASEKYTNKHHKLEEQLRIWNLGYISYLAQDELLSPPVHRPASKKVGGLHLIYHYACMTLHRHMHHATLTTDQIKLHATEAYVHACETLEIAQQLVGISGKDIQDGHLATTSALTGYAVVAAIDILTAAALKSDLLENDGRLMRLMMKGGVPLLDALAEHWESAKEQRDLVSERTKILFSSLRANSVDGKVGFFVTEPILQPFDKEFDLVYGVNRLQYTEAMGWHGSIRNYGDLLEISMREKR